MKTFFKWLYRLLFYALLIAIVLPLAATFYLKESDYKSIIEDWVESRMGRKLDIKGGLGFRLETGLILFAGGVRLENVSWSDHSDMFRANKLEAHISISELLQGNVVVKHILLKEAELLVEQDQGGQLNLAIPTAVNTQDVKPLVVPEWLNIRSVTIEKGRIVADMRWRDWDVQIDKGQLSASSPNTPVQLVASGSLNAVPITINGTLGTTTTWLQRQESTGELDLTILDTHRFTAKGTVQDVLGWHGIEADVEGGLSRLRDITPWFRYTPLALDNVRLTGRLVQPSSFSTISFEDFSGSADYHGIPFRANGRVGRLARLSELEVNVNAESDWNLEGLALGDFVKLKPKIVIEALFTGATYRLNMDVHQLTLTTSGMTLEGKGQVSNASRLWEQGLPLQLTLDSIHGLGVALERNWPKAGGVRANGVLIKDETGFVLRSVNFETTGKLLSLKGEGKIQGVGKKQQGLLRILGTAEREFFHQNNLLPFFQPGFAEVDTLWHLEGDQHRLNIEHLLLKYPGGQFRGQGKIPDLQSPGALTLTLNGLLDDPMTFGALHDLTLPKFPSLGSDILVHGQGAGHWAIEATEFSDSRDTVPLSMVGKVNLSPKINNINLHFEGAVQADSLKPWLEESSGGNALLAHLGAVQVAFDLRTTSENNLTLQNLKLESDWAGIGLEVQGELPTLKPQRGYLTASASGRLQESLNPLPHWPLNFEEIDLSFNIPWPWEDQRLENLQLKMRSDSGSLSLVGDIDRMEPLDFDQLDVLMTVEDITRIAAFEKLVIPGNGFSTKARLKMKAGALAAEGTGWIGENQYTGSIQWKAAKGNERAVLDIDLSMEQLNIERLLPKNRKQKQKFSQKPLLPAWTRQIDGHLRLGINDYWGRTMHLSDLTIQSRLEAGSVDTSIVAALGQGVFRGHIRSPDQNKLRLEMALEQLPPEALRAWSKNDSLIGGQIDASIILEGESSTIAGLLERGEGQVRIDILNSRFKGKTLGTVGGDLLTNVLGAFNVFDSNDQYTDLECGVLYLDISEGKAVTRNGLALKTDRVTIVGGGEIQFPGEEISFVLTPKAREGLGINASSLARAVQLKGTLKDPTIKIKPGGLLAAGVNMATAIATGGVTLIALGLYDRVHANSDVCSIARGLKQEEGAQTGSNISLGSNHQ